MRAVFFPRYGSPNVLEVREIEKPVPTEDEALVKVYASSVNPSEWYSMKGLLIGRLGNGLLKPSRTRLGTDFAGVVEAVGQNVMQFKPGDEVFGARGGAFADYVCVSKMIFPKPANMTFEEAGSVGVAAITALQALRDYGKVQAGQKVLINGASGGVGTFAVQIAKVLGAEVTAVCSTRNVERARLLGADHVVDYTKEEFTRSGQRYDLMIDIAGSRSWAACRRVLTSNATVVIVGGRSMPLIGPLGHVIRMKLASLGSTRKVVFFIAKFNKEDMLFLKDLLETGRVKPVVEQSYPLSEVAEAMRHLGAGHAQGKIVVTMR